MWISINYYDEPEWVEEQDDQDIDREEQWLERDISNETDLPF